MTRILGTVVCVVTLATLLFTQLHIGQPSWNAVSTIYLCGFAFTLNAQLQDMCKAKKWARFSRIAAALFYLFTVALLVLIILDWQGIVMFR